MTKTELMLLMKTDGNPVMPLAKLAELRGISLKTAQNQISAKTHPVPVWKDGGEWFAHVSDIATFIDRQREAAANELAMTGR